ncbi:G-type lectin S-receptor-like serine/threonine-protein kinase, partial [Trifolium medium]|nr:G-type lectin S-receptor-like serine/threonine-protein kinase [Trifolium medium]
RRIAHMFKQDKENIQRNVRGQFYDSERHVKNLIDMEGLEENDNDGIEVPYFDFESILIATDDFSDANKLGKGGFGPVYKGKLGGQEIAVKRLSSVSSQGLQEFKNEVVLIAKLQHRN